MVDIICVVDRSGSMAHLKEETVSNFNKFVEEQKELPGKAKLTLVLFNHEYDLVYDRVKLEKVEPLTLEQYNVGGWTALYDAVGKTITKLQNRKKAILMILTDGMENASTEYKTAAPVKALVEDRQKAGWQVMYLGVGIDNFADAHGIGVQVHHMYTATADTKGVSLTYDTMRSATTSYREEHSTTAAD